MRSAALAIPQPVCVTAQQWEELPEDEGVRTEVVDGLLQVSPWPTFPHQLVVGRLFALLAASCPADLVVLPGLEVRLQDDPLHVRVPDLLVVRRPADNRHARPDEVVLAVEIISPSSLTTDRRYKRADYAAAGIPNYWVLDARDPDVQLEAGVLFEGQYVSLAGTTERPVHLDQPFPIDIDLAQLAR